MITLTKKQIDLALPKIESGLDKYLWLQNNLRRCNVSTSEEYQRKFNGYYKVRKNEKWRKLFYTCLEVKKKFKPDFSLILFLIYLRGYPGCPKGKRKPVDASFASKLVATLNPQSPIIDSVVLKNLGLKIKASKKLRLGRFNMAIRIYQEIVELYKQFLASETGKYLVAQFKKKYPDKKISKVKMLDFVLWQTRD